jgi:hypothetical protein
MLSKGIRRSTRRHGSSVYWRAVREVRLVETRYLSSIREVALFRNGNTFPNLPSGPPEAEQDLQIPSTVTSGGVKFLKPNLGQSHLVSNLVFGSWR